MKYKIALGSIIRCQDQGNSSISSISEQLKIVVNLNNIFPPVDLFYPITYFTLQMTFIYVLGFIFSLKFMAVFVFCLVKNCWPKGSIPKDRTSSELDRRYHHDLIDMDGLIVPVGRPPPRVPRRAPPLPAPPSYNDSIDLPGENAAQGLTPQYSY